MRVLFFILLVLPLLPSSGPLFGQEEDKFEPVYALILTEKVNIRAGQGLNFEILGRLTQGNEVVVIGQEYGWYRIKLPDQALSFVHQDYIEGNSVKADRLRVRAGAGTNFNILGILKKGEPVKILSEDGDWLKITPPENCAGWIKKDYLQLSKRTFIPPPPEPPLPGEKIEVSGKLQDLGKIFRRQGTHKLTRGKKVLYYLKSETIDLNRYVNKKVNIIGELKDSENSPYPVIKVKEIKKKRWF